MVHQFDPDRRPDADFERGDVSHLVVGNECRSLDPRRTPFRVVAVAPSTGLVTLEILAFEDAGATWDIPVEDIHHYQFLRGSAAASSADVAALARAVERFDRPWLVAADAAIGAATAQRIEALADQAAAAVSIDSLDLTSRTGSDALADDVRAFMDAAGLLDLEAAFAEQYVRNPNSGELVKGHRVVIAELGLVSYAGKVARTPDLFDGAWSRQRRAEHILHRLAFVRAAFRRCGLERVTLYRGLYLTGALEPTTDATFVSTSFDVDVARSCMGEAAADAAGILFRQPVPVSRLFMTYAETREMNLHYQEAEAVLLNNPAGALF
jgi:hypothetical protein